MTADTKNWIALGLCLVGGIGLILTGSPWWLVFYLPFLTRINWRGE